MKAVILAGGLGARRAEEIVLRPWPMVEIGARPILWHMTKTCVARGACGFMICLGCQRHMIRDYFVNDWLHKSGIMAETLRVTRCLRNAIAALPKTCGRREARRGKPGSDRAKASARRRDIAA